VSNAITEALDQAVERVGKALGQDAGTAIEKLYRDTDGNLKDVIERTAKADADKADEIKKIADDMAKNAEKDVTTQAERNAQADTQAGLRKKLTGILDPDADPNAGIRGLGKDDPDVEQLKTQAAGRVGELQDSVPANSRGRITMVTSIGRDEAGNLRTVVSTSEPRGYLRPGVTLKDGEELATGDGHAEVSGIDYMNQHGITPVAVGAGKPICTPCETTIDNAGAAPATKLKGSGPRPTKKRKI
jgi:hypothetical protein